MRVKARRFLWPCCPSHGFYILHFCPTDRRSVVMWHLVRRGLWAWVGTEWPSLCMAMPREGARRAARDMQTHHVYDARNIVQEALVLREREHVRKRRHSGELVVSRRRGRVDPLLLAPVVHRLDDAPHALPRSLHRVDADRGGQWVANGPLCKFALSCLAFCHCAARAGHVAAREHRLQILRAAHVLHECRKSCLHTAMSFSFGTPTHTHTQTRAPLFSGPRGHFNTVPLPRTVYRP